MFATVSPKGIEFTKSREGTVTRAYKDQGGVVTIGNGFTNLSPLCRAWFIENFGHPLQMGDKMTEAQCVELLARVLQSEVAPAVAKYVEPQTQAEMDGSADVAFNAGVGSLKWRWAVALKARQVAAAANLLLTTAVTAAGVPNAGLRNRRRAEASLIKDGVYGPGTGAVSTDPEDVRQHQQDLKTLGYYKGPIDGKVDNPEYIAGVKNFQRISGLRVDGDVGTATRSALARAVTGRKGLVTSTGGGLGTGGLAGLGMHLDNPWMAVAIGVGVLAVIYVAFLLWQHRGVLTGTRTPA